MGILGLAVLDGIVSRQQASSNVSGWLSGAGSAVRRFLDPTVPLFPAVTTATTTAATTASPSVQPSTAASAAASAVAGSIAGL